MGPGTRGVATSWTFEDDAEKKRKNHLQVFLLLLLQEPLQIIKVIVFKVLDDAPGCLKTLLDGEAGRLIPEHKTKDKINHQATAFKKTGTWRRTGSSHLSTFQAQLLPPSSSVNLHRSLKEILLRTLFPSRKFYSHKNDVPPLGIGRNRTRNGGKPIGVDDCLFCFHEVGQTSLQLQVNICMRRSRKNRL